MGEPTQVQVVTAKQAAELTGLSERTIMRMIVRRQLPATRFASNRDAINVANLARFRRNDPHAALAREVCAMRQDRFMRLEHIERRLAA